MTLIPDLEEAGFEVAGPFTRGDESMRWLDTHTPDLAVLDIILGDGPCSALARQLRSRGVPFLVFSGHDRGPDVPKEFWGVPWIEKPGSFEALSEELAHLVPGQTLATTALAPAE
jgi:DNA-binding response OmpR family regulator